MYDPNDYLHVQMTIGKKGVQVINGAGKVIMGARGRSDKHALKRLDKCLEAIQEARAGRETLPLE